MDGQRVSTIIVDSNEDSALVCVDDHGFHPKEISVPKVLCLSCCYFVSLVFTRLNKTENSGQSETEYLLIDDSKSL